MDQNTLIENLRRAAPRCGARTRSGASCACQALRGRRRCRLHGGLNPGAPRGATNGNFKTGIGRLRQSKSADGFGRSLGKQRRKANEEEACAGRSADRSGSARFGCVASHLRTRTGRSAPSQSAVASPVPSPARQEMSKSVTQDVEPFRTHAAPLRGSLHLEYRRCGRPNCPVLQRRPSRALGRPPVARGRPAAEVAGARRGRARGARSYCGAESAWIRRADRQELAARPAIAGRDVLRCAMARKTGWGRRPVLSFQGRTEAVATTPARE